jgi:hypothetical protein
MTDAPERIYAWDYFDPWGNELRWWSPEGEEGVKLDGDEARYTRSDISAAREAKLVEALREIAGHMEYAGFNNPSPTRAALVARAILSELGLDK